MLLYRPQNWHFASSTDDCWIYLKLSGRNIQGGIQVHWIGLAGAIMTVDSTENFQRRVHTHLVPVFPDTLFQVQMESIVDSPLVFMDFFPMQRKSFPTFLEQKALTFGWRRSFFGAPTKQLQSSRIPPWIWMLPDKALWIFPHCQIVDFVHDENQCLAFAKMQTMLQIDGVWETC